MGATRTRTLSGCGRYGRWLATSASVHLPAPADDCLTFRGCVLCVFVVVVVVVVVVVDVAVVIDVCCSSLLLLLLLLLRGSRQLMVLAMQ